MKSSKKPTGLRSDEVRELHIALTQYALVITPWWLFITIVRGDVANCVQIKKVPTGSRSKKINAGY